MCTESPPKAPHWRQANSEKHNQILGNDLHWEKNQQHDKLGQPEILQLDHRREQSERDITALKGWWRAVN